MNKKRRLIAVASIVGVLILAAVFIFEQKETNKIARPTLDYSDEMILSLPYFDIVAAAAENRHLASDVESFSFGDGIIYLTIPSQVSIKSLVVYIRDENGVNLARRVWDFSETVKLGDWTIVIDRPKLPTMFFNAGDAESFAIMNESPTTDVLCYGDMAISVDKETAGMNGWFEEYVSVERDGDTPCTAALQGRGSSSWDCEVKKSYSLRLEKAENLLGMGSNRNWNLIGNPYDVSLLKNLTFNNLAKEVGINYQPKMEPINLFVDGVYQGVYLLTTKVSVDNDRIALSDGDFLYKVDAPVCEQPIYYESAVWFEDGNTRPVVDLMYPENASEDKLEKAGRIFQNFINAVEDVSSDAIYDIADIDSLVKYYWIQEASMNFDAWARSVYLYYDKSEDKIFFGPVWDMDLTLGSPYEKAGMTFTEPEGFRVASAGWYYALLQRPEFFKTVVEMYNNGIGEKLNKLPEEFYKQKEALGVDAYRNYAIFGHSNMGVTINYGDTYDEYCDNMIDFYKRRIDWIDSMISVQ